MLHCSACCYVKLKALASRAKEIALKKQELREQENKVKLQAAENERMREEVGAYPCLFYTHFIQHLKSSLILGLKLENKLTSGLFIENFK